MATNEVSAPTHPTFFHYCIMERWGKEARQEVNENKKREREGIKSGTREFVQGECAIVGCAR